MNITPMLILLSFLLLLTIGTFFLQVFLSKRENRWLGLILPLLTLLFSLLLSANVIATPDALPILIVIFLLSNLPTAIHLIIYFTCRKKFQNKKQIEKMDIQDL